MLIFYFISCFTCFFSYSRNSFRAKLLFGNWQWGRLTYLFCIKQFKTFFKSSNLYKYWNFEENSQITYYNFLALKNAAFRTLKISEFRVYNLDFNQNSKVTFWSKFLNEQKLMRARTQSTRWLAPLKQTPQTLIQVSILYFCNDIFKFLFAIFYIIFQFVHKLKIRFHFVDIL